MKKLLTVSLSLFIIHSPLPSTSHSIPFTSLFLFLFPPFFLFSVSPISSLFVHFVSPVFFSLFIHFVSPFAGQFISTSFSLKKLLDHLLEEHRGETLYFGLKLCFVGDPVRHTSVHCNTEVYG